MNFRRAAVDWLSLIRLPNTFTVIADSTAGFLLASHSLEPTIRYLPMVCGVVFLYWSGMILNDLMDQEKDRQQRPHRPISAGRVSATSAAIAVISFMAMGIGLSAISGQIPVPGYRQEWTPGLIATGIAIAIWLYDGPLKKTILAPITMGTCRFGSLLLGAAPVLSSEHEFLFPVTILLAAAGMGLLIAGITTAGRREADSDGDHSRGPLIGLVVTIIGLGCLAIAPRFSRSDQWQLDPQLGFPLLIAAMGLPLVYRGGVAVRRPQPEYLQAFVTHGIMLIIPLSAALAALAAGPIYGLSVFALTFPAMSLTNWFRVT